MEATLLFLSAALTSGERIGLCSLLPGEGWGGLCLFANVNTSMRVKGISFLNLSSDSMQFKAYVPGREEKFFSPGT